MVMGRPNKGIEHIDGCDGSDESKERAKMILKTITGELSVTDACDELNISRARFAELRAKALQGSVDAIEPKPAGRPTIAPTEADEREAKLHRHVDALKQQLLVSEARALVSELYSDEKKGPWPRARPGTR